MKKHVVRLDPGQSYVLLLSSFLIRNTAGTKRKDVNICNISFTQETNVKHLQHFVKLPPYGCVSLQMNLSGLLRKPGEKKKNRLEIVTD